MMKKYLPFAFFLFLQICFCPLFSSPADQINEYVLENGMEVFLLEDFWFELWI